MNQENALKQQFNFQALSAFRQPQTKSCCSKKWLVLIFIAIAATIWYNLLGSTKAIISNFDGMQTEKESNEKNVTHQHQSDLHFDFMQQLNPKCFVSEEEQEIIAEPIAIQTQQSKTVTNVYLPVAYFNISAYIHSFASDPAQPTILKSVSHETMKNDNDDPIEEKSNATTTIQYSPLQKSSTQHKNDPSIEMIEPMQPELSKIYEENDWFFVKAFKIIKRGYEIDMARHQHDYQIYEQWKLDNQ